MHIQNRVPLKQDWPALAAYSLLALFYTYPLARDFTASVAGGGDPFQFLWDFWWLPKALFEPGQSLFHTDFVFYPNGASLAFHEFSLLNCFLSLPIRPLLGGAATYNLLLFLSYALGGFNAYRLGQRLTGCAKSSFVMGLCFAYTAFHHNHASRLHMASIEWLPLYVLAFLELAETPTWKRSATAAFWFVVNALTTWYYLVFLSLWSAAAWVWLGLRLKRQGRTGAGLRALAVFAGLCLAGVGPFLWPAVLEVLGGEHYMTLSQARGFSADLEALFAMPMSHPIGGAAFLPLYQKLLTHPTEREVFLGYLPVLLALVGLLRGRKAWGWAASGAGFLLLALGPHPQAGGVEYSSIPLPYAWISKLPFLSAMRAPTRAMSMVALFQSILACLGCQLLFQSFARRRERWAWVLALLFGAQIMAEQLQTPLRFPMSPARAENHPLYLALKDEPASAVVLDLPIPGLFYPNPMYYQTLHGKRMLGGYVARPSPRMWDTIHANPVLHYLAVLPSYRGSSVFGFSEQGELRIFEFKPLPEPLEFPAPPASPEETLDALRRAGIRFVILHRAAYPAEAFDKLRGLFEQAHAPLYFEDATLLAYDLEGQGSRPRPNP